MLPDELERYLHRSIPLTEAMGVSVIGADEHSITLRAPLAPNINHRQTVFGGSASAVAMLAAWSLLYTRLVAAGIDARLVIRRNTMEYEAPISGDFEARSSVAASLDWDSFVTLLERKGKARIGASAAIRQEGRVVARFAGEFVALQSNRRSPT
jgi:thioesterase domain-containing protein